MSDIVEDVKRAIWIHRCRQEVGEPICDVNDIDEMYDWEGTANVAIAAATPHIRAALFDELIARITSVGDCLFGEPHADYCPDYDVAEWIAAQKRKENTQP
jgi:hypothetical protein